MPFICLANANVPNGVLQITDLFPNVSQNNNPTNPPGQTRYLRRPGTDVPAVNLTAGRVQGSAADFGKQQFDGLAAYLLDRVEPGAASVAEAQVVLNGTLAGDQIAIKGIVFEFAGGANNLAGRAGTLGDPFIVGLGASDNDAAANLAAALNDAGDVHPAMDAVLPPNTHTLGTNVGAPSATVLIQPEDAVAALVTGFDGEFQIGVSNETRLQLDADSERVARLYRATGAWDTATLELAVAAVQNLVDSAAAATLAGVNTALASVGAELTGATSNSTGTLLELLSVLAGRTYRIDAGALKYLPVTAPNEVSVWDATQRGSFTTPVSVYATDMLGGEWGPVLTGVKPVRVGGSDSRPVFSSAGDVVNNEIAGARSTYDSTAFQASVQNGQLAQFANGVTLFPDAEVQAFAARRHPNGLPALARVAELTNQRLVTVYDDDGTLLV